MNMPGFTAETSLYQTNNHYRSAGGSFPNNWNTTVTPQGCGIFSSEFWTCAGYVAAVSGFCTAVCVAASTLGPPGWAVCFGCAVGVIGETALVACRDCLPGAIRDVINQYLSQDGGGGGGGRTPPPPRCSSTQKCCGTLNPDGTCDGICWARNLSCP
jgi:hypothetical protein